MRISGVESTDLFQGTPSRPLQVIRVTVESTQAREAGAPATLRIAGPGADTPAPFGITGAEPGEGRTYELAVAVTGAPGTIRSSPEMATRTPVVFRMSQDHARAQLWAK